MSGRLIQDSLLEGGAPTYTGHDSAGSDTETSCQNYHRSLSCCNRIHHVYNFPVTYNWPFLYMVINFPVINLQEGVEHDHGS